MAVVSKQKSNLLEQFNETRTKTLNLVQTLEKDDFVVQTAPFTSPPKWHLGHVSWLLEVVMSKTTNNYDCLLYTSPSPRDLSTSRMPSSA